MYPLGDSHAYASWTREHDQLSDADRDAIRDRAARAPGTLVFSVVVAAPALGLDTLARRAVASVRGQLCPSWELLAPDHLLGGGGDSRHVALPVADDPVDLLNLALARARGQFIIMLPPDAVLAEHAIFEFAAAAEGRPALDMLYSDEDQVDSRGHRSAPRFKTAWDTDLMLGRNAVGHAAALRTATVRRLGGWRPGISAELSQYDLMLRLGAATLPSRIHHLGAILCHRAAAGPASAWDGAGARGVVRRHLDATGVTGARVEPAPLLPAYSRVVRRLPDPAPLVSVIVPTRDRADLLARCAAGVLERTDYAPLELLIIDNDSRERVTGDLLASLARDSRVRVLPYAGAFNFAAMNNAAIRQARGAIIVLLNNDTDVLGPGWLAEMVSHALRPEIGAVGAKLLYGDGRVQHCGITLGPDWSLIHQLRLSDRFDPGPDGELALVRTVSAVTGACMAFRASVFSEVGGLDADQFRVALNDVDLCLRMGDHGYRIVCTPFAELLHLESVTRGHDDTPEKRQLNALETQAFRALWDPLLDADPFHNPNVVFRWDESVLAAPPRRPRPWMKTVA